MTAVAEAREQIDMNEIDHQLRRGALDEPFGVSFVEVPAVQVQSRRQHARAPCRVSPSRGQLRGFVEFAGHRRGGELASGSR